MIDAMQYKLTWDHFEELHEDKRMMFEYLCRSLFYRSFCKEEQLHSNPNNPGIETEPCLAKDNKTKIAFQAKYFDGEIDYSQIKKSIETMIRHYKDRIDCVYLFCNKDVNVHAKKYKSIESMLKSNEIRLVSITDQSILELAMQYDQVKSRFFGLDTLNNEWFTNNLALSLTGLGKRFNSLFNITTEAQNLLSVFLKESAGIEYLNEKKRRLLEELTALKTYKNKKYKRYINSFILTVNTLDDVTVNSVEEALKWESEILSRCSKEIAEMKKERKELSESRLKNSDRDEIDVGIDLIDTILDLINNLHISEEEKAVVKSRVLVVNGEMGTGKSQLLATAAKRLQDNGQPVLLILGQSLISEDIVENQLMKSLQIVSNNSTFDSLMAAIDEIAYAENKPAYLFIDAINETRHREVWKQGIDRVLSCVDKYKNIRIVLSVRTGFERVVLSENALNKIEQYKIGKITHHGFAEITPNKINEFLSNYNVPFSPEYYLNNDMVNPLFLSWFCQVYRGREEDLLAIINTVIQQADDEASREAGFDEPINILKDLLLAFIDLNKQKSISRMDITSLSIWDKYGVQDRISYIRALERNGIISSFMIDEQEHYYIGFNFIEDYLEAEKILFDYDEKMPIKEYCIRKFFLHDESNHWYIGNEDLFVMFATLYSIKYKKECIDVIDEIPNDWDKQRILKRYVEKYTWNSTNISLEGFIKLANKYSLPPRIIWSVFIENATKENSALNSTGLTTLLKTYSLNKRDYLWTIYINELSELDRIINLIYYIEEGNSFAALSEEKMTLLLQLFTWFLSSTNRKTRDRTSKAMIEILKNRFHMGLSLLKQFFKVNDPYIIQRLFGIVFGAVMKRDKENKEDFGFLTDWIYNNVFCEETVYPDILLRDYARLIIERFIFEYPDQSLGIDFSVMRPPYRSDAIPQVTAIDYNQKEYHETGLWRLMMSMKFDLEVKGIGMYGDFGRYVYQAALSHFKGVDEKNVYYYSLDYILNYLGYDNDLFGEYDSKIIDYGRHDVKKVERIGKKYQWITMYNILARLSDTYQLGYTWTAETRQFCGPWDPYVRDFDPTLNTHIKSKDLLPKLRVFNPKEEEFLPFDDSIDNARKWKKQESKLHNFVEKLLINKDADGIKWICLYSNQDVEVKPNDAEYELLTTVYGEQHVWSIATAYYTKLRQKINHEEIIASGLLENDRGTIRDCYSLFNREYAWSPGYLDEFENTMEEDCSASIDAKPCSINYLWEEEYDASQEDTTSFLIPCGFIIRSMKLFEKEADGVYYDSKGIAAFSQKEVDYSKSFRFNNLFIRGDILDQFLEKEQLSLFWTVIGEKQFFLGNYNQEYAPKDQYYFYDNGVVHTSGELSVLV